MKYRNKILLVCPAAVRDVANAAAEQVMGPGNDKSFTAAQADKDAPGVITCYAANAVMTDAFVPQLVALATNFPMILGFVSGPADFTSLAGFDNVTILDDMDPHAVLASLNLVPAVLEG